MPNMFGLFKSKRSSTIIQAVPERSALSSGTMRFKSKTGDAPPAYDTAPASMTAKRTSTMQSLRGPARQNTESEYEFLKDYDTIFLVDDSRSMIIKDCSGGQSRWHDAGRALAATVQIAAKYDDDGVDIYFMNNAKSAATGIKQTSAVMQLFDNVQPNGATPTGKAIDGILRPYLGKLKKSGLRNVKPINLVVITDGSPTDDPEDVIVDLAKKLDQLDAPLSQVGIQFIQIGNDATALEALEYLDDGLKEKYHIRDMVDTTPFSGHFDELTILKSLLGGINKRMDRVENS